MAVKKIYNDIMPIRPGFSAPIAIKYSADFWSAYNMGSGNLSVSIRDTVESATELWQGDTESGEITVDAPNRMVTITIPRATTLDWKSKDFVTFDIMRYTASSRIAIPGIWKWPVVRRSTTEIPS